MRAQRPFFTALSGIPSNPTAAQAIRRAEHPAFTVTDRDAAFRAATLLKDFMLVFFKESALKCHRKQ
jgi:hypothetical protein